LRFCQPAQVITRPYEIFCADRVDVSPSALPEDVAES
jgi:hypothetical protein